MKTNTRKPNKCLIEIKRLPLDRFRIPSPGRKWKHIARQVQALLMYLATFANGDGTFNHGDVDYSPSVKTQAEHFGFSRRWIYTLQDNLKALGFLTWERLNRQEGRKYTITIPEVNDSSNSDVNDSSSEVNDSSNSDVNDSSSEVNDSIPEVNSASHPEVNSCSHTSVLPSYKPSYQPSQVGGQDLEEAVRWVREKFRRQPGRFFRHGMHRSYFSTVCPKL